MNMSFMNNTQVSNLHDHKHILGVVLLTVQQSLLTAKADFEDLMLLLNQEMKAKDFLISKVKNLEEDLIASKANIKESLQQTILDERGRITKIQWDRDEYLRKVLQIESRLKLEETERIRAESKKIATSADRQMLLVELSTTTKDLEKLEKRLVEVEMKSKADIKVLVKEVKFLRNSQESLREFLKHCMREKNEIEMVLQKETQRRKNAVITRQLLSEFQDLRRRLEECSVNFLADEEEKFTVNSASLSDALGLLITSDNRISLLMAELLLTVDPRRASLAAAPHRFLLGRRSQEIVTHWANLIPQNKEEEYNPRRTHKIYVKNCFFTRNLNHSLSLSVNSSHVLIEDVCEEPVWSV